MRILLPPSETKRIGGRHRLSSDALPHQEALEQTRTLVRSALLEVSVDEEAAVKALKLGKKNRNERELNLALSTSGVMPAIERYTGVVFDALGVLELEQHSRDWINEHVAIQSALFGLIGAGALIPGYRLSASSRLPELGSNLARVWADPHRDLLTSANYVLDLRSKDYAALAPLTTLGARQSDFVEVVARGDNGEVRALNHFNKAAKGELVRLLAETTPSLASREEFIAWSQEHGLEVSPGEAPGTLRLVARHSTPALAR